MNFENLEKEIYAYVANTGVFVKGEQKLKRMEDMMEFLGNPQDKLKVLHVAGTSGKTSTSYFAAAFLKQAGQRVGLTVSPHVIDVRERAQVELSVLEENVYVTEVSEYLALLRSANQKPSYMEFFMGFFYWLAERMKLDYVVVETGLGGLYDASNVIRRRDKVCLITDIGYDHTEILGDTMAEISKEKAGIITPGNEAFMHEQTSEIMNVMIDAADKQKSVLHIVPETEFEELPEFQLRNAGLALAAVKFVLARDGKDPMTKDQIKQATRVPIPARAEEFLYKGRKVIIDGAHNPQKLEAFVSYITKKYGDRKITLVTTLGSNKIANVFDDMKIMRRISGSVILTTFKDTSVETHFRRSLSTELLYEAAKEATFRDIKVVHDPVEALEAAAGVSGDIVVATGSFFLLNHIRPVLMQSASSPE